MSTPSGAGVRFDDDVQYYLFEAEGQISPAGDHGRREGAPGDTPGEVTPVAARSHTEESSAAAAGAVAAGTPAAARQAVGLPLAGATQPSSGGSPDSLDAEWQHLQEEETRGVHSDGRTGADTVPEHRRIDTPVVDSGAESGSSPALTPEPAAAPVPASLPREARRVAANAGSMASVPARARKLRPSVRDGASELGGPADDAGSSESDREPQTGMQFRSASGASIWRELRRKHAMRAGARATRQAFGDQAERGSQPSASGEPDVGRSRPSSGAAPLAPPLSAYPRTQQVVLSKLKRPATSWLPRSRLSLRAPTAVPDTAASDEENAPPAATSADQPKTSSPTVPRHVSSAQAAALAAQAAAAAAAVRSETLGGSTLWAPRVANPSCQKARGGPSLSATGAPNLQGVGHSPCRNAGEQAHRDSHALRRVCGRESAACTSEPVAVESERDDEGDAGSDNTLHSIDSPQRSRSHSPAYPRAGGSRNRRSANRSATSRSLSPPRSPALRDFEVPSPYLSWEPKTRAQQERDWQVGLREYKPDEDAQQATRPRWSSRREYARSPSPEREIRHLPEKEHAESSVPAALAFRSRIPRRLVTNAARNGRAPKSRHAGSAECRPQGLTRTQQLQQRHREERQRQREVQQRKRERRVAQSAKKSSMTPTPAKTRPRSSSAARGRSRGVQTAAAREGQRSTVQSLGAVARDFKAVDAAIDAVRAPTPAKVLSSRAKGEGVETRKAEPSSSRPARPVDTPDAPRVPDRTSPDSIEEELRDSADTHSEAAKGHEGFDSDFNARLFDAALPTTESRIRRSRALALRILPLDVPDWSEPEARAFIDAGPTFTPFNDDSNGQGVSFAAWSAEALSRNARWAATSLRAARVVLLTALQTHQDHLQSLHKKLRSCMRDLAVQEYLTGSDGSTPDGSDMRGRMRSEAAEREARALLRGAGRGVGGRARGRGGGSRSRGRERGVLRGAGRGGGGPWDGTAFKLILLRGLTHKLRLKIVLVALQFNADRSRRVHAILHQRSQKLILASRAAAWLSMRASVNQRAAQMAVANRALAHFFRRRIANMLAQWRAGHSRRRDFILRSEVAVHAWQLRTCQKILLAWRDVVVQEAALRIAEQWHRRNTLSTTFYALREAAVRPAPSTTRSGRRKSSARSTGSPTSPRAQRSKLGSRRSVSVRSPSPASMGRKSSSRAASPSPSLGQSGGRSGGGFSAAVARAQAMGVFQLSLRDGVVAVRERRRAAERNTAEALSTAPLRDSAAGSEATTPGSSVHATHEAGPESPPVFGVEGDSFAVPEADWRGSPHRSVSRTMAIAARAASVRSHLSRATAVARVTERASSTRSSSVAGSTRASDDARSGAVRSGGGDRPRLPASVPAASSDGAASTDLGLWSGHQNSLFSEVGDSDSTGSSEAESKTVSDGDVGADADTAAQPHSMRAPPRLSRAGGALQLPMNASDSMAAPPRTPSPSPSPSPPLSQSSDRVRRSGQSERSQSSSHSRSRSPRGQRGINLPGGTEQAAGTRGTGSLPDRSASEERRSRRPGIPRSPHRRASSPGPLSGGIGARAQALQSGSQRGGSPLRSETKVPLQASPLSLASRSPARSVASSSKRSRVSSKSRGSPGAKSLKSATRSKRLKTVASIAGRAAGRKRRASTPKRDPSAAGSPAVSPATSRGRGTAVLAAVASSANRAKSTVKRRRVTATAGKRGASTQADRGGSPSVAGSDSVRRSPVRPDAKPATDKTKRGRSTKLRRTGALIRATVKTRPRPVTRKAKLSAVRKRKVKRAGALRGSVISAFRGGVRARARGHGAGSDDDDTHSVDHPSDGSDWEGADHDGHGEESEPEMVDDDGDSRGNTAEDDLRDEREERAIAELLEVSTPVNSPGGSVQADHSLNATQATDSAVELMLGGAVGLLLDADETASDAVLSPASGSSPLKRRAPRSAGSAASSRRTHKVGKAHAAGPGVSPASSKRRVVRKRVGMPQRITALIVAEQRAAQVRAERHYERKLMRLVYRSWGTLAMSTRGVARLQAAWTRRRMAGALLMWRISVDTLQAARQAAEQRFVVGVMRRAIAAWKRGIEQQRSDAAKLVRGIRLRHLGRRALNAWLSYMRARSEEVQRQLAALSHHRMTAWRRCFQQWRAYAQRCTRLREAEEAVSAAHDTRTVRELFARWRARGHRDAVLRRVTAAAALRWAARLRDESDPTRAKLMRSVVSAWRAVAEPRVALIRRRRHEREATSRCARARKRRFLRHWRGAALMARAIRRHLLRHRGQLALNVLQQWKSFIADQRRAVEEFEVFWRIQRPIYKCFKSWSTGWRVRRHARRVVVGPALKLWVQHYRSTLVTPALALWRRRSQQRVIHKLYSRAFMAKMWRRALVVRDAALKRRAFHELRRVVARSVYCRDAVHHAQSQQLTRLASRVLHAVRRLLVARRVWRRKVGAAVIAAWRRFKDARIALRKLEVQAVDWRNMRLRTGCAYCVPLLPPTLRQSAPVGRMPEGHGGIPYTSGELDPAAVLRGSATVAQRAAPNHRVRTAVGLAHNVGTFTRMGVPRSGDRTRGRGWRPGDNVWEYQPLTSRWWRQSIRAVASEGDFDDDKRDDDDDPSPAIELAARVAIGMDKENSPSGDADSDDDSSTDAGSTIRMNVTRALPQHLSTGIDLCDTGSLLRSMPEWRAEPNQPVLVCMKGRRPFLSRFVGGDFGLALRAVHAWRHNAVRHPARARTGCLLKPRNVSRSRC